MGKEGGKEMIVNMEGEGREGSEGVGRDEKGKGGMGMRR